MVWWLNSAVGSVISIIFLPFSSLNPWVAMLVISLLTALLMLFIYKKTSNQERIRRVKNRIKASLLEIRLYQNDLPAQLGSQKELLLSNLQYLLYNLKPLLVMIVPVFLVLAQLNLWFASRPPGQGETFLLKARFIKTVDLLRLRVDLETPEGLILETPPVRIIDEGEVSWRLKVTGPVREPLVVQVNGERYQKQIVAGKKQLTRVSTVRVKRNLWQELLYAGERPLPADSLLTRIELAFQPRRLNLLGAGLHWLLAYFLLSIILGLSLKGLFKVEI